MSPIDLLGWFVGAVLVLSLVAILAVLFVVPLLFEILKERMFP